MASRSEDKGMAGRFVYILWGAMVIAVTALSGCNQGPFQAAQSRPWQAPQQPQQEFASQLQDQQRRLQQLDANNRDLHAQLAQQQQQYRLTKQELDLIKQQFSSTVAELKKKTAALQNTERSFQALQASTRQLSGAQITANNSVKKTLQAVQVPGMVIGLDGEVVRIQLAASQLFQPNSTTLKPTANQVLEQAANVITRYYPQQRVGVEGHTGTGVTNAHQVSSAWAAAVFTHLTQRNRLPERQLFTMGLGGNHPRVSNATTEGRIQNQRIELVIYPETM